MIRLSDLEDLAYGNDESECVEGVQKTWFEPVVDDEGNVVATMQIVECPECGTHPIQMFTDGSEEMEFLAYVLGYRPDFEEEDFD